MSKANALLILLLCASPVVLLLGGAMTDGVVSGVTAIGLAIVALTLRPGETEFFLSVARRPAMIATVPAIWMSLQALPIRPLSHPIWSSAEVAIGHSLPDAITVDIGATVMALGQYLTIGAIGFWTAAVAVDRQRAETILFTLMAATALIAGMLLASDYLGMYAFSAAFQNFRRMQAADCAAIGVIIALLGAIRTIERYETRHASPNRSVSALVKDFLFCMLAIGLCLAASFAASGGVPIAVAFGAVAVGAAVCVRRFGLGSWGAAGLALPIVIAAAYLITREPALRTEGIALAFAHQTPAAGISLTQRILADAPLRGTGAGTFTALVPIYREIDDQAVHSIAPTSAAAISIELGRPFLWAVVVTAALVFIALLRASLQRGRDSFYAMAGAGGLVVVLGLGFINGGLQGTAVGMVAAAVLGLACAQCKSRTVPR